MAKIKNKRILIINEDNQDYLKSLEESLINEGAKHESTTSLKQGINNAISNKWDIILINFNAHVENQIDLKRALTLFDGYHIPVILLYEETKPSEKSIAFTSQKSSIVEFPKSKSTNDLMALIQKTLNENGSVSIVRDKIVKTSTLEKPTIVKALAALLLLEPLIKILYFWGSTEFEFSRVINNVFHIDSFGEVFEFWFLYPLGGLALLSRWAWSFLAFMLIQLIVLFRNLTYEPYTWPYVDSGPHFSSVLLLVINVLIVLYFFSRAGRKHFINKKGFQLREATRFQINFPCKLFYDEWNEAFLGTMSNISESGLFVVCTQKIFLDDKIKISLDIEEKNYIFEAVVMNRRAEGYGLKFIFRDLADKKLIKKLIEKIHST